MPWKLKTQPSPHSAHISPNGHWLKEPVPLSLGPGWPATPRVLSQRLSLPPSSSGLDSPRLDDRPPPHPAPGCSDANVSREEPLPSPTSNQHVGTCLPLAPRLSHPTAPRLERKARYSG